MERQKTQNKQHIVKDKNKVGGFILYDFKIYFKVLVIKTVQWQIDESNRLDNLEIEPFKYSKLILGKGINTYVIEKKRSFCHHYLLFI